MKPWIPFTQGRSQGFDKPISQDFRVSIKIEDFTISLSNTIVNFSCSKQGNLELRTCRNKDGGDRSSLGVKNSKTHLDIVMEVQLTFSAVV
jgi:hypothetical protein